MIAFVVRRIPQSVIAIWGAVTLIFIIVRIIPGDPISVLYGAEGASVEAIEEARREHGLDRPILIQYGEYLLRVIRLDMGDSFVSRGPATEFFLERLPATLQLATTAILIAIVVGVLLGMVAAARSGGLVDRFLLIFSLLGQSLPAFWLGPMLLLISARQLQLLPSVGTGGIAHLILPATTLALPLIAIISRMTRQAALEVLSSGYVETARAKGLSEPIVFARHVTKNVMIPVITVIGLQFGELLTGSVVVEMVFTWPGVGNLLISSISRRDYPTVEVAMLFIAITFVVVNLLVDLIYGYLDPRVQVGAGSRR